MPDQSPLNSVDAVKRWYADKLESYAGAVGLFFVLELLIYVIDQLHWVATLVITLVLAVLLVPLMVAWKRQLFDKYPDSITGATLLFTALASVVVFAAASMLIYRWNPQTYVAQRSLTLITFSGFYLWQVVDALPGLQFWDAFGVKAPIQQQGVVAGSLLLVFRVGILTTLVTAMKAWLALRRGPASVAPGLY